MKNVAILTGAGKGKRMGNKDKSFLLLKGKPVLFYSILAFEKCSLIDEIILAVQKNKIIQAEKLVLQNKFKKVKKIVSGGNNRQESILNCFKKIKKANIVLVHDVARPLVSKKIIEQVIKQTEKYKAVIPAISVKDTIKKGDKFVEKTIDREKLNLVQTPQSFKFNILKKAYQEAKNFKGTDDAYLVEKIGYKVKIIPGSLENIKITFKEDLTFIKKIIT